MLLVSLCLSVHHKTIKYVHYDVCFSSYGMHIDQCHCNIHAYNVIFMRTIWRMLLLTETVNFTRLWNPLQSSSHKVLYFCIFPALLKKGHFALSQKAEKRISSELRTPTLKLNNQPKKGHSSSARANGKIAMLILAKWELMKTRLIPKTSSQLVYVHASVATNVSSVWRAIQSDRRA